MNALEEVFGPVIYAYTRAQAIEDGVLVDVTETAKEASFRWPVAVTAEVWGTIETIPPQLRGWQSVDGRLWDVLWMASLAARCSKGAPEVMYNLYMDRNERGRRVKKLTLKMVIGGGDDGEPVITIMMPWED